MSFVARGGPFESALPFGGNRFLDGKHRRAFFATHLGRGSLSQLVFGDAVLGVALGAVESHRSHAVRLGAVPAATGSRQSKRCKWLRIASRVLSSGAKANARSHISVDLL